MATCWTMFKTDIEWGQPKNIWHSDGIGISVKFLFMTRRMVILDVLE